MKEKKGHVFYLTKQVPFFVLFLLCPVCNFFVISNSVCSLFISRGYLRSFNSKKKRKKKKVFLYSLLPCIKNNHVKRKKKAKNVILLPSTIALFGEFLFFLPFPREISFFLFSFISLFLFIIMLYTERLVALLYRK